MATRTGRIPFTRIPAGPISPASVFTTPARPGKIPLEMASSGSGTRTEAASTNTIEPPVPGHGAGSGVAVQVGHQCPGQPHGAEVDAFER